MDEILAKLAEHIGKRKSDLKKTADAIEKKEETAVLKGVVPKEAYQELVLRGVCKRYEISDEILDELLGKESVPDVEQEEREAVDEEIKDIKNKIKNEVKDMTWENVFGSVPNQKEIDEETGFRKLDNLKTLANIPYKLKLEDPTEPPFQYDGVGKDGKDYTSYAINVILTEKVEDSPFKVGEVYKLWLKESAFGNFVRFWRDDCGLDSPDDRVFTYKKAEKTSTKTGRTYHQISFK